MFSHFIRMQERRWTGAAKFQELGIATDWLVALKIC